MGYSLSWAALKGGNLQTACAALGLRETGKREEIPDSDIVGTQLPTGWCLVLFDHNVIEERFLKQLSQAGEVVYCFVEDHVMYSSASGWNSGREIWQVAHDGGERGVLHLETGGNPPAEFEGIRKELFARQVAADRDKVEVDHVYEIPAELAKQLTGFRHDQDTPGLSGDVFTVLESPKENKTASLGNVFKKLLRPKDKRK
jgi:hypothetical protein